MFFFTFKILSMDNVKKIKEGLEKAYKKLIEFKKYKKNTTDCSKRWKNC